jgi:hypothetical protein
MKLRKITIVYAEGKDWDAIYIDDELETENPHIYPINLINIIEKYQHFEPQIQKWYVKDAYLEGVGNYPTLLSDIPQKAFVM